MKWIGIVLFLVLLAGCNAQPLEAQPGAVANTPETVEITTSDGVLLNGHLYPSGSDLAVVFAHMGIDDQTAWMPFAAQVAGSGVTTLTFDFRCYGQSDCAPGDDDRVHLLDLQAAIAFLRERGYARIACIGSSMGAAACLNASMLEDMAGMAFIAGPFATPIDGQLYPQDILNPGMSKLFLVADQDPYSSVIQATQSFHDRSPDPKKLVIYKDVAHGTDLFKTVSKELFGKDLMDFILGLR